MNHAYGDSPAFTVGVEEELLLVDADGRRLAPVAEQVLAGLELDRARVGHEAYAAELELRSSPSSRALDVATELGALRARVTAAGAALMGVGIHPLSSWGDAPLVGSERYAAVGRMMRGLIRRTPECALHIHVAMPDPQTAICAFNGLRAHLPLLIGLSANSPWWFGSDSGLASARHALVRSYPRRGVPAPLRDFEHYCEVVAAVTAAGELSDYTFLWWDVRLHPRLGTVEVREMDAQSRLGDVAVLAALVQGLACHEAQNPRRSIPPTEAISESCFRASRDGLDAFVVDGAGRRSLREVAGEALALALPYAREQGNHHLLRAGLGRLLGEGGGASRQRDAQRAGGTQAMLEQLLRETGAPVRGDEDQAP